MKAYLINPKERSVSEVEFDGTLGGVIKHYPYNALCVDMSRFTDSNIDAIAHLPLQMVAIAGEELINKDGAWGYMCDRCDEIHTVVGKALIIGRKEVSDEECEPADPQMTIQEARKFVKWARVCKLDKEETMELLENGNLPDRLTGKEDPFSAEAIVAGSLETHRILSSVH